LQTSGRIQREIDSISIQLSEPLQDCINERIDPDCHLSRSEHHIANVLFCKDLQTVIPSADTAFNVACERCAIRLQDLNLREAHAFSVERHLLARPTLAIVRL
jgi:hypothetical protein